MTRARNSERMRKRIATWMTLAACLLAILLTISAALYLAHRQSVVEESAAAAAMSRELLRRVDDMGIQASDAYERLSAARMADPCADRGLALMRDIGMKSNYLQAVGHVRDGRLLCSSFGRYDGGLPLGPIAYVSAMGASIRPSVDLGLGGDRRFLVLEKGQFATAIHGSTMLDVFTDRNGISLGIYGISSGLPLATRGAFDPAWTKRLGDEQQATFYDGDHLVSIQRSSQFDLATYTAVPTELLVKRLREIATLLLPLGLLLGAGLSLAVFYLARQQNSTITSLRLALKRHEFVLHYQPIVNLETRRMVGVEVLMRWPREGGDVRPDMFIRAAEDTGLIGQFTEYVVAKISKDAPVYLARFPDCYISINLSSPDLHDVCTVDLLRRLITTPGIPAANIMVELTEHSFRDAARATPTVKAIRALGIRVAIDDFGTGFSNLAQLATLEVDVLKIDKVFIDAIGTAAPTSEVALHIIHMGESLGLTVIGEGIETEAQAQFLHDYGVGYGQGWLYARACPLAEVLRMQA